MTLPLGLGLAYAVLAALLLSLNLQTPWRREIKAGAIILVSLLYAASYYGARDLRGWARATLPPEPFKLHWAVIEEPNKLTGEAGQIFILAQEISAHGALRGAPRLYGVPFSSSLAEEIEEALEAIDDGQVLEAHLKYEASENRDAETLRRQEGERSRPTDDAETYVLKLEFRDLPSPDLPPKSQ